MKTSVKYTIAVGATANLFVFLWPLRLSVLIDVLCMAGVGAVLALAVANLLIPASSGKTPSLRSAVPLIISLVSVPMMALSLSAGHMAREGIFRMRIPRYEEVISKMVKGEIAVPEGSFERIDLPDKYRGLAVATLSDRGTNGILTVEFITGGGFPVKHSGYLYRSSGTLEEWEHADRWPHSRQIADHWYRISD